MPDHPTVDAVVLRAATRDDRTALLDLIGNGVGGTAYHELPLYFVRLAFEGPPEESRAIVAMRDGVVVGCALFGTVAGAVGTGRIHFIAVADQARRAGIATRLCGAAVADLSAHGARSVVAELPDDPALTAGRAMLTRCDFTTVARVPDYYRDGVALFVLYRAILPPL